MFQKTSLGGVGTLPSKKSADSMNDAAPQIKLTNSRRKYDDIMLSIIVIFFAINLANCEEVWQELCSGENGSLYFENSGNNHIATTYIDKNKNVLTEFLSDDTTYKFRCDSSNGAPNMTLGKVLTFN